MLFTPTIKRDFNCIEVGMKVWKKPTTKFWYMLFKISKSSKRYKINNVSICLISSLSTFSLNCQKKTSFRLLRFLKDLIIFQLTFCTCLEDFNLHKMIVKMLTILRWQTSTFTTRLLMLYLTKTHLKAYQSISETFKI